MNSHPSSDSTRSIVLDGGGAPATTMRTVPRPGMARPSAARVSAAPRMAATTAGRAAQQRDTVLLDARQDLLAVDLAQHDVHAAHAGHRVRHAPSVAVEHRQRVQEHVAIADAGVPAEGGGIEPAVALGQLHALGSRRCSRRVVHRAGGVLVGLPGPRRRAVWGRCEQRGVVAPSRQKRWATLMESTSSVRSGSYRRTDAPECSTT